ncbi:glycine betaine ABC transporter substrate-binding protein [Oceanobacter mangrovi]|uniref:glycine betaine ABC transporter substrate-binding protein n=1 Tax=Oceanobacter mangrovi TaxID=2862510 RepID=UPI001C8D293E|nr:glycine betaine ABC transporter substrate-binding protein [Oceanobacter mangrovi]
MFKPAFKPLLLAAALATSSLVSPVQASTIANNQCMDVRLGQVAWTDLQVVTEIADTLLTRLGYQPQVRDMDSLGDLYKAMSDDQLDVFMGYWLPSQQTMAAPYMQKGDFETLTTNLEQAQMTLAVPDYVYQQGIHSLADLATHKDKFEGRIYGAEAGSSAHRAIQRMIDSNAYGLGSFKLIETSERIMLAQLNGRIKKGDWVVILGWSPHPMNKNFDIRYLSGGDEFFGPNSGKATVATNVRPEFDQSCQNVTKLLRNLQFDAGVEEAIMDQVSNGFVPLERAVRIWMNKNPQQLQQWLSGVTTVSGDKPDAFALAESLKVGWGKLED